MKIPFNRHSAYMVLLCYLFLNIIHGFKIGYLIPKDSNVSNLPTVTSSGRAFLLAISRTNSSYEWKDSMCSDANALNEFINLNRNNADIIIGPVCQTGKWFSSYADIIIGSVCHSGDWFSSYADIIIGPVCHSGKWFRSNADIIIGPVCHCCKWFSSNDDIIIEYVILVSDLVVILT